MRTQIRIGKWVVETSQTTVTMSQRESSALSEIAGRWIGAFPREPETLAWAKLGAPSALIRFDYVLGPDGLPRVFEVEDRPAGLGLNSVVCPGFAERLRRRMDGIREAVGRPVEIFVTEPRRETCDDSLLPEAAPGAFDAVRVGGTPGPDAALLVRCALGEEGLAHLESRSISTVSREGDKSYGVALGLWREVSGEESLDYDVPFVLKPAQGCGSRGVTLYHPDRRGAGFDKRQRVARAVLAGQARYVQPFYEPEASPDGDGLKMIRRVLYAWDPSARRYEPLGGSWNARPNVKIHGASDTVTGPVLPPA
jgi:hypothetical protein